MARSDVATCSLKSAHDDRSIGPGDAILLNTILGNQQTIQHSIPPLGTSADVRFGLRLSINFAGVYARRTVTRGEYFSTTLAGLPFIRDDSFSPLSASAALINTHGSDICHSRHVRSIAHCKAAPVGLVQARWSGAR